MSTALEMLQRLSENVGAQQTQLNQLRSEAPQRGFRNEGQTGMEALMNPDDAQSRGLMDIGLRMLGGDKRMSGGAIAADSISKGLSLMDTIKESDQAKKVSVQEGMLKGSQGAFDRGMDIAGVIPKPEKPVYSGSTINNMDVPDGKGGFTRKAVRQFTSGPRSGELEVVDDKFGSETVTGSTPTDIMPGTAAGKPMTMEAAGKAAMVENAIVKADKLDALLFDKKEDGTPDFENPNRTNIGTMTVNPFPGAGLPGTEGREMGTIISDMVESKIRLESGAAVPPEEIVRAKLRFQPSLLDSSQTILVKRQLLRDYFTTTKKLYDPQGNITIAGSLWMDKADKQIEEQEIRTPGVQDTVKREGKPDAVKGADGKWYYKNPKQTGVQ
jgi:hypothetical protein